MRACAWVVCVVALGGCHRALSVPEVDLGVDFSVPDFAFGSSDLSSICGLPAPNAMVTIPSLEPFRYAWLGSADTGGEANCGPPAEATRVTILQHDDPLGSPTLWFDLALLVQEGHYQVDVFVIGTDLLRLEGHGTVDITSVTTSPAGVEALSGILSVPSLQLGGSFGAQHCAILDASCI